MPDNWNFCVIAAQKSAIAKNSWLPALALFGGF
jgi:hypothetical protein